MCETEEEGEREKEREGRKEGNGREGKQREKEGKKSEIGKEKNVNVQKLIIYFQVGSNTKEMKETIMRHGLGLRDHHCRQKHSQ